tara:strand:+ start:984 stop:1796 length:813 start_codon:yes stop_codon:yes gene_type:complete
MSTSRTREKADGELFKSTGIDDNATSTAVTIDSSGSVLVAGSSTNPVGTNVVGHAMGSDGRVQHSTTGNTVMKTNQTTDGDIVQFRKAGSAVGSIGTNGSRPYLTNPTYGGISVADYRINPVNASGAAWDNALNLGAGGSRWKDLYLSGGVYLGGTGAANKLDDYESATWTPALGGTWSSNPTNMYGTYTKIGNVVHITFYFSGGSKTSIVAGYFTGLPFATSSAGTGSVSDSGVNDRGNCLFFNTDRVWVTNNSFSGATYITGTYIATA